LGFSLSVETESLILRDGKAIVEVAAERTRDELARLLAHWHSAPHLHTLDRLGLLTSILPDLEALRRLDQSPPHELDVLSHSLQTVASLEEILLGLGLGAREGNAGPSKLGLLELLPFAKRLEGHLGRLMSAARPRLVTLKLAALFHDVGKPGVRAVEAGGRVRFIGHEVSGVEKTGQALRHLRFSRAEVRLAETIVTHHMRPLQLASLDRVTNRAVYRFFRDTGEAGIDVLLHALADNLAKSASGDMGPRWPRAVRLAARMMDDYWQRFDKKVAPPSFVSGQDLMAELGLEPGPLLGEILDSVREAQAVGEVISREQALNWAQAYRLKADQGQQTG
jgi:tRNA nucleotidyltransferase/poly(A) polymerase